MKTIIIVTGLAIVMGVIVRYVPNEYTAVGNNEVEKEVIKEVQVEKLEERIKTAQDEARIEIETKAQEAYDALYEDEMNKVSDSVKTQYIAEIEATITSEDY